jgi:hypothetical protein
MGSEGMCLSPWNLDFNTEKKITISPMWVRLPHLPLIFWDDNSLIAIGNKLDWFIDHAKPKGNLYSFVRICVETDLEKGIP